VDTVSYVANLFVAAGVRHEKFRLFVTFVVLGTSLACFAQSGTDYNTLVQQGKTQLQAGSAEQGVGTEMIQITSQ
jgi:hypothetical protein